ncbi:MAG: signal peptide peptidase SppA [Bacillota bacterium]|nr:signal peptide peptidase SppA [Bacillota bacterium]
MDPTRKRILVYVLAGAVVLSMLYGLTASPGNDSGLATGAGGDSIGIIYIEGAIAGGHSSSSLYGTTLGSDNILALIREAEKDPSIRALVLRINSPGGTVAAADDIAVQLQKFRRTGRTVLTSMSDVAASGAYWVAANTDKIWASQGTMTGSIGVIWEIARLEGLYKKLGIEFEVIKSGPYKDMGSPARGLQEEERKILQAMVDDTYDQFITTILGGRKISREDLLKIADGRVLTGRQAKQAGLVDELGNMYDAINDAAKMAGLTTFRIRELGRLSPLERLMNRLGEVSSALPGAGEVTGNRVLDMVWLLRQILMMPGESLVR